MKPFPRKEWGGKRAALPVEPRAIRARGEDDMAVSMLLSGIVLEAIVGSLRIVCAIG